MKFYTYKKTTLKRIEEIRENKGSYKDIKTLITNEMWGLCDPNVCNFLDKVYLRERGLAELETGVNPDDSEVLKSFEIAAKHIKECKGS